MSIFSAFMGKSQAKDIKRANQQATTFVNQGFDKAEGAVGEARTNAQGYFQPYAESGVRSNALLDDALGVNGAEGGGRAMTAYRSASNPFLDYQQGETENALLRSMNARGLNNSGASAAAAAKARMGLGYQDYQGWLDRIGQQQGQGLQVAGQQAGIEQGYGQQRADLATGRAGTLAGNAIQYGNAMAATRGVGINNLLNIAGTAAKAFAASDIRLKRDVERIGALPSGLPVYRFKYLWSDQDHIGVMAQEAAQLFPDAVATMPNGFLAVDYAGIS